MKRLIAVGMCLVSLGVMAADKQVSGKADCPVAKGCSAADAVTPFRATGNEPGWDLLIEQETMTLKTDYGNRVIQVAVPQKRLVANGWHYAVRTEEQALGITVKKELCKDTMTGIPTPYTVQVRLDDLVLDGCGGESQDLLQGQWLVTKMGGKPVNKKKPVTLTFSENGRLSANAGCNQLMGRYSLSSEGLTVGDIAATRKMCQPDLMKQEKVLSDTLSDLVSFDMDEDGTLVLSASSGIEVEAYKMP